MTVETRTYRPNFFVPGAQKSGSTSLHNYLAAHSQCLMAEPKETFYFGPNWVESKFPVYLKHFSLPCESGEHHYDSNVHQASVNSPLYGNTDSIRAIGEVTPSYLSTPKVPEQIRMQLGSDIRFVCLLRNPVDRAYSAYLHMKVQFGDLRSVKRALGHDANSLDEAIDLELSASRQSIEDGTINTDSSISTMGDPIWNFRYLRNSTYLDDLKRFESVFGRDQILVIFFEEMFCDPVVAFKSIADFLGIDSSQLPTNLGTQYNSTQVPRFGRITKWFDTLSKVPHSGRFANRLRSFTYVRNPTIDPDLRSSLTRLFQGHNESLSRYLDRDLSEIWK